MTQNLTLINKVTGHHIGDFEYVTIPKVGEWMLTPDNDGTGSNIWIVNIVVHFPRYTNMKNNEPRVVIHVSPSTKEKELSIIPNGVVEKFDLSGLKCVKY
jgi:hypothetical protein